MNLDFTDTFKTALAKDDPLHQLRDALIQLRSEGVQKAILIEALESYYGQVDDVTGDIVVDAMDFLYGWCSPHMRID